jgi:hypothetical protein
MRRITHPFSVIPAKAGIQLLRLEVRELDSRLRGNDEVFSIGGTA